MNASFSYREAAVAGASPVRLIILLYEQAMEDLRRALSAHARGDVEGRTREINHAILVVGHLQATLDRERGGRVAENLSRFYDLVRSKLVEAQYKQSSSMIEEQISQLIHVRDAWCTVEKEISAVKVDEAASPAAEGSEWRA